VNGHVKQLPGFASRVAAGMRERLRSIVAMLNSLSARLLIGVLIVSGCATLLVTAVQLAVDYRRDVSAINLRLDQIDENHREGLAESVWTGDANRLRLELDEILRIPDVSAVEVREAKAAGEPPIAKLGNGPKAPILARDYPLRHKVQGQDTVVGTLHVEATLADVYSGLADTALMILVHRAATAVVVSAFILYLFYRLVSRHLSAIATYLGNYRIDESPLELRLQRHQPRHGDALERLVTTLNIHCRDLHLAHRDLSEREAKIQRLVDANIVGIFNWDLDGRITEANDAFLRIVGYDRDDLKAARIRWTDLTPLEWRSDTAERVSEMKATGSVQPYEKEYFRKDGTRVPILLGSALFQKDGTRGVSFVVDLTARKQAEAELRESEERFRTLVQFSFDVYWETDAQHRVVRQEFAEGLVDAPPRGSELGTARWDDPYLEPDEEGWRKHRETVEAHLPFRDFELARPTPSGGKRYVSVSGLPMFDATGCFVGHRGVGRHITERKLAEEAARRTEKELRQVVETIPAMVWTAAPDGRAEFINRRWQEFTGLTLEKTSLWRWEAEAAFHPEEFKGYLERWSASLATGRPFEMETRMRRAADGAYRWVLESAVPLFDEQGSILKWYGFVLDIEDRKRAEEGLQKALADLAHANRVATMGQLTAAIAHEVNQPIATARNNASAALRFLNRQQPDLDEIREALDCVVNDTDRASDIISRVRDHIKKAPPVRESFDVNGVIYEILALSRYEAIRNGVLVRSSLAKGLPSVRGDRVQVQQVVLNLVVNAVEAMISDREGPRDLLICTEPNQEGGVLIAVCDVGPGVDADSAERIFDSFYTTKSRGMGMGLSICRSIIAAHGGRLWVDSNTPRGAVFRFTLPGEPTNS